MTDDERAEMIDRKYQFLAEQEEREAAEDDPLQQALARPLGETHNMRVAREITEQKARWAEAREKRERAVEPPLQRRLDALERELANTRSVLRAEISATHVSALKIVGEAFDRAGEAVGEWMAEQRKQMDDKVRSQNDQISDLRTSNAELRVMNYKLQEAMLGGNNETVDLPPLPLRPLKNVN